MVSVRLAQLRLLVQAIPYSPGMQTAEFATPSWVDKALVSCVNQLEAMMRES